MAQGVVIRQVSRFSGRRVEISGVPHGFNLNQAQAKTEAIARNSQISAI